MKKIAESQVRGLFNKEQGKIRNGTIPNADSATIDAIESEDLEPGKIGTSLLLTPIEQQALNLTREILAGRENRHKLSNLTEEILADEIGEACTKLNIELTDIERSRIASFLKADLFGWGILQPLIDDPSVTDIHCYDYNTIVVQHGKETEPTNYSFANAVTYRNFLDRILLMMGSNLSTQKHTVDGAFPNGIRICAIHDAVCGSRGPFLTIRIPRIKKVSIENLVKYGVAPPFIVNYLGALVETRAHTIIVSGETGTGKTTMVRCFGSRFQPGESIIGVEETPELNYQHPYYRSLVSRKANSEGVGEVTLQEHIRSTLRLCPTRVILGEIRTPKAAEAFLEATQTGHAGLSTIHARNASETITRLEALVGQAQRGVNTDVIRQQIALAVDVICWCLRERESGAVRLGELIEVGGFSEGNVQVRPMFKLIQEGKHPMWEVQSLSSNFDKVLEKKGLKLSEVSKQLTL